MMKKLYILTLFSCVTLSAQVDSTGIQPKKMVDFDVDSTQINTHGVFNFEKVGSDQDSITAPASVKEMPGTSVEMMAQYTLKGLEVSGGTPYSTNQILVARKLKFLVRKSIMRLKNYGELTCSLMLSSSLLKLWGTKFILELI